MIRSRDLVRALGDHDLADWVVVERDQTIGCADSATQLRRAERRLKWQLTVHHDAPTGRGSAYVVIDAAEGNADALVRQAVTLARASVGPAWVTQPASAPARVKLEDAKLAAADPLASATGVIRAIERPAGVTVHASAQVTREQVNVVSRQGVHAAWNATHVRGDVLVSVGGRTLTATREARQLSELRLGGAIAGAIKDLELLATATAIAPGPCVLVLRPDALLHGGLGVWQAFVTQADAVVERQGLTRYRERTPIAVGADHIADPLSITSDGALELGVYSAPVGDQGDAVRRFSLVERGIASGLGLAPREAALRGRDPNGGVRNLVVATGTWPGVIDASLPRVVEVRRLRSLSIDPYTGDASLELAVALDHAKGSAKPVAGGSLRIDMIAALARARRSAQRIMRGPYSGPDAVVIEHADVIS